MKNDPGVGPLFIFFHKIRSCLVVALTLAISTTAAETVGRQTSPVIGSAGASTEVLAKQVIKDVGGKGTANWRMAQRKRFKYEVPKATRVAPTTPAPTYTPRSAPAPRYAPRAAPRGVPRTRGALPPMESERAPPSQGGGGMMIQIGPFGFAVGGGGARSCETCRLNCAVARDNCGRSRRCRSRYSSCMRRCSAGMCR